MPSFFLHEYCCRPTVSLLLQHKAIFITLFFSHLTILLDPTKWECRFSCSAKKRERVRSHLQGKTFSPSLLPCLGFNTPESRILDLCSPPHPFFLVGGFRLVSICPGWCLPPFSLGPRCTLLFFPCAHTGQLPFPLPRLKEQPPQCLIATAAMSPNFSSRANLGH